MHVSVFLELQGNQGRPHVFHILDYWPSMLKNMEMSSRLNQSSNEHVLRSIGHIIVFESHKFVVANIIHPTTLASVGSFFLFSIFIYFLLINVFGECSSMFTSS